MLALIVLSSSRLYALKKYIFLDICQNPSNSSIIIVHWNSLEKHYVIRAVVSGEARGAAAPLGPVEIDTSILWMDLFSLDSVSLIIVIFNCLPFSYSRSIFRRHISWQVLKIAFRSLQIENFLGEDTPRPPYKVRAFGTRDNLPRYKKPSHSPGDV